MATTTPSTTPKKAPAKKPAGKPAGPKKAAEATKAPAKPKKAQAAKKGARTWAPDNAGPAPRAPKVAPQSKQDAVIALLKRDEGATIAQITAATDWQAHSIRGFFAGTLKKRKGIHVSSRSDPAGRVYFIQPDQGDAAQAEVPEAV